MLPIRGNSKPDGANEQRDDGVLAERAGTGDRDAFEAIYRRHQDRIYGLCLRLTGDRVEAEELVQQTFVRAWTSLGGYSGHGSLGAWLARIAVNRWRDHWRSKHRRNTVPLENEEATSEITTARGTGSGNPADATVIPLLTAMDLERCVARLPLGARTVYVLHEIEGFAHHEIAEKMQLATGTVKAQLHRARRLLRVMLTETKEQTHEA